MWPEKCELSQLTEVVARKYNTCYAHVVNIVSHISDDYILINLFNDIVVSQSVSIKSHAIQ